MIREAIIILAALFAWGAAGGLEKGLLTITEALIAWMAAALVITITLLTRRGEHG